jgi:hypothetical protein
MRRKTELVELAETHNIALCITRLRQPYGNTRWRRALYHALAIADINNDLLRKIREALELP